MLPQSEASRHLSEKLALAKPGGFLVLQRNMDTCLQETHWRRLLIFALLPTLAALTSCGGGGGSSGTTTTPPANLVSCVPAQVTLNGKSLCTAMITGLSSTSVGTWEVAGVAGGDATHGKIDSSGNYTAPATFPTANVITITALAQAQTTLTGNATVTILQPTVISSVICQDSGTQTLSISSGRSLACTATASGGTVIPAFWSVDGVPGGAAATGFITAQGVYIAPQIPPPGGTVTVKAVSQADSTQTQTVTVSVTFGNAALKGAYAFSTSGRVISGNTFFARAGSFTAGGDGTLIGGDEDYNQVGQAAGKTRHPFTGTYSIGQDGRGTMQFCDDINTCTTGAATAFFNIAVFSAQQAQMIEFSKPKSPVALKVGSGEMDLQPSDASIFTDGGLIDTYSFSFAGVSSAATPQSDVGEFTADGQGGIEANTSSSPGRMDINGVTQNLVASSYSVSANGRGTATIGLSSFSFYIVSPSRAKFIEIDTSAILVGDAFKQQVSPSSPCSWGPNGLNGAIAFETGGAKSGAGITDLVSFTADGSGGVTAGFIDENSGGTVSSLPASSPSDKYGVDTCGRGTLSISTHSYVFYMISVGNAVIQEVTAGVVAHGTLVQPQSGPFTAASLSGSYALNLAGTNAASIVAGNEEDLVGQLTTSGTTNSQSGKVTTGSIDVNNNVASLGATQTVSPEAGPYAVAASGNRATMTLTSPQNLLLYIVSPTQVFAMVGNDNTGVVAIGSLDKQF
jgi:hypothetical protein